MPTTTANQIGEVRTAFGFKRTVSLGNGVIECWGAGSFFEWLFTSTRGEKFTDGKTYDSIPTAITAAKKFLSDRPKEKPQLPKPMSLDAQMRRIKKLSAEFQKIKKQ